MGMDAGGGKLPYSYPAHQDGKLVKSFSRVEPRKFGLGLVAGFLLVTCAYFSTAKFDAIHVAMTVSPVSGNAAGIGPLVGAANADTSDSKQRLDLGKQDPDDALSRSEEEEGSRADEVLEKDDGKASSSSGTDSGSNAPLEDTRRDETFVGDSGGASSAAGARSEAVPARHEHDDDAPAAALLPPVTSEGAANSTQGSGVLEDEELQVQDAVANPSKRSNDSAATRSSSSGRSPSVVHSDPAILPAPSQQIAPAAPQEADKALAVQHIPAIPEVKQSDSETPAREWKPLCDITSNRRIDWCELDGDVRVLGANASVTLVAPPGGADGRTFRAESWRIKPYPRKADPNAMRVVRVLTVRSVPGEAPACTDRHGVPALVFSDRGYTGNYFHAFTDVILPLFLTARQYAGEVRLLVTDLQAWWVGKFAPVFRSISNYELVDLDRDPRVHCFRHVQVGLTSHDDFSIDPLRAPNGYSMLDFTGFMRAAYGLPRGDVAAAGPSSKRRPRLLVIARARTRRFVNAEEIVRGAEKLGFEVVVSEGTHEVAPFAELANSCDAIMGVHGAGLTNMVFVPTGGVVIQVVPLGGLEFVAGYFRGPSRDMGLRYLEYRITPEESTLINQYPRDHPIFTDPNGIKSKGWESLKDAYLDKQDVSLDMKRFRPTLKKAIAHIRKARAKANAGGGGNN
ncbi:Protein O-linked-mannose beta-1,4-N-acetylglucosaminyltransferase 2 [Zea mays]|uniref:Protein O-linked-mannose beta-1,4-N-acetylglucosaminyltransferase 2 n=1 Tax=Zea mays TaxID=4577 RepID=A0A3L6FRW6_MAIZE|nr:Protein O-linked-mannose beta-1,4-N-acetylglucosaminyltransferase 2 [Zea mays]